MPTLAKRPCTVNGCPELVDRGRCPAHEAQRQRQQDQQRGSSASRGYDRRWRLARDIWLAQHPLCTDPYKLHPRRYVAANVVDHIVPHRGDPVKFWDRTNWQSLCTPCHGHKTCQEQHFSQPTQSRRQGRVYLVYGPPCGGKSTYVENHRAAGDLVIDYDIIMSQMSGRPIHDHDSALHEAVQSRWNNDVRCVSSSDFAGTAWIITAAPYPDMIQRIAREARAETIRIDPGVDTCVLRMQARGHTDGLDVRVAQWYGQKWS